MTRKWEQHLGDNDLVYGMLKHIHAVAGEDDGNTTYRTASDSTFDEVKEWYKENVEANVVWVWQSNPDACTKCQALNGKIFYSKSQIPEKPHPNCNCKATRCFQRQLYGEWKVTWKGKPVDECKAAINIINLYKTALWTRSFWVKEERVVQTIIHCDETAMVLDEKINKRERIAKINMRSPVIIYSRGADIEYGDTWISNNPWTGETKGGTFKPGP